MSTQKEKREKVVQSITELDESSTKTEGLCKSKTQDCLMNLILSMTERDFEKFSKECIDQYKNTDNSKVRPITRDNGIDFEGEFENIKFAGQAKHNKITNTISRPKLSQLAGDAFIFDNFDEAYFVTTSYYTRNAKEKARDCDKMNIIDGDKLINIIIDNEIGVNKTSSGYNIDKHFWKKYDKKLRDEIDTIEIPQADSISKLDDCILAINKNYHYSPEILKHIDGISDKRQADYYANLAKNLGFAYKDGTGEYNGKNMNKWYLTDLGRQYLDSIKKNKDKEDRNILQNQIRNLSIIEKVLDTMNPKISKDKIEDIVDKYTDLADSTTVRRSDTVKKLLNELPEIEEINNDNHIYRKR